MTLPSGAINAALGRADGLGQLERWLLLVRDWRTREDHQPWRFRVRTALALVAMSAFLFAALVAGADAAAKRSSLGGTCGGPVGLQCKRDLSCHYKPVELCGAAVPTGTCQLQAPRCEKIRSLVCGCDGKTYANDCSRRNAGVGKRAGGACKPGPKASAAPN
jgi:Kazal-type serine protease inhibitor domain